MTDATTALSSYWEETAPPPAAATPHAPATCEVCVIGAGIAGLTTAYLLGREGRRVVVVDAMKPGSGQTAKTTAHLSNVIDDRFKTLQSVRGAEVAKIACESHGAAIDTIEEIVLREAISCDFERVPGYLFLAPGHDRKELQDELKAAQEAGHTDAEWIEDFRIAGKSVGHCIRFPRQGQFHPLRYLAGLERAIVRQGGTIVPDARVTDVSDGEPKEVRLESGHGLTARDVVIATNTPFTTRFAIHTKQAPYLTYVVAMRVDPMHLPPGLYWDTEDPYHYVRLARDGTRPLAIVGGDDHKTGQAGDQRQRFERLEAWARNLVPQLGPVEFRWSGQVMETLDGLGYIGRNPGEPKGAFIATGDSGMGMTHGTIAGILLTRLIVDGSHPWEKAYDPGRFPLRTVGEYASENFNVALQYADWLGSGDVPDVGSIERNTGAILKRGRDKLAVYRDESGIVHAFKAACPHMGCVVSWNPAELTWDCPCHGSRFDRLGRVIQGPANVGLSETAIEVPVKVAT